MMCTGPGCPHAEHRRPLTATVAVQVSIPLWALVHLPVVVTITTAAFTPRGWLHCILYVLFENAMGIVKLGAVIAGASMIQSDYLPPWQI